RGPPSPRRLMGGRERVRCYGTVFAPAKAFDLAVAQPPVVMHRHRGRPAGGDRSERPVDQQVDVVVTGGEAAGGELGDFDARVDVAEETRDALLAVASPVPRRGVAGGLGRPVHIVGDALAEWRDVPGAH